jgi:hypothetical protein
VPRTAITERLQSWASILDDVTREQALVTSRMPFIHPHVALMPDAHLGLGATVGSVIPTRRALMPAAVGVDIGCGMMALRTDLTSGDLPRDRRRLRTRIEREVPLSAGGHNSSVRGGRTSQRIAVLEEAAADAGFDPGTYARGWRLQLGSGRATTSSRSASTRSTASGCSCTAARAASATRSPSTTSASHDVRATSGPSSCPTLTSPISRRAPTSSPRTSRSCGGRSTSPCSTARR